MSTEPTAGPLWLLAELTYRCPLHCVFCSNPLDYVQHRDELTTDDWLRVLHEARALGAVQLGFSGGEPLLRDDLEVLVQEAHRLGYYTNLITSGIGLTDARAAALKAAGLDHVQLSFQDSTRELNDFLSSTRTFDLKSKVAATIGFALSAGRAAIMLKPLSMPFSCAAMPSRTCPSTNSGWPLAWKLRKSVGVPVWPVTKFVPLTT